MMDDLPPIFSSVHDHEWCDSHFVFEAPNGKRFKVAKDDVSYVIPKAESEARQPGLHMGAHFSDGFITFRASDGLWYVPGDDEHPEDASEWHDVWKRHGDDAWRILIPSPPDKIPFMLAYEGPKGSIVIPDMSLGEPTPGFVAEVGDDGMLNVRDTRTRERIVLNPREFSDIVGMYIRTMMNLQPLVPEVPGNGHKHTED